MYFSHQSPDKTQACPGLTNPLCLAPQKTKKKEGWKTRVKKKNFNPSYIPDSRVFEACRPDPQREK